MEDTFSHDQIVREVENGNLKILFDKDQLNHVRNDDLAFHELSEAPVTFPPTFKHVIDSDVYDVKRRPAWTDRILYRVNSYNLEDLGTKNKEFISDIYIYIYKLVTTSVQDGHTTV